MKASRLQSAKSCPHRAKLHSTDPIERLNGEIKRRTAVVGIFRNDRLSEWLHGISQFGISQESLKGLVGALGLEPRTR